MRALADALKAQRIRAGLSVVQMAELLCKSRIHVHRIEASDNLTEATARRYAEALGLRLSVTLVPK